MDQPTAVPRGRPRSARAREATLRAASELLRERGYPGLTIEAIAARAGVGKQTIYRWWPSKGAVLLDAFRDDLAAAAPQPSEDAGGAGEGNSAPDDAPSDGSQARRTAAAFLAADIRWDDSGDFAADLAAQVRRMAATLADPAFGPYIAALTCEALLDPAFAAEYRRQILDPSREAWRAIFARAQAAGDIRPDVDLDIAIDLLNGPLWYRLLLRPGAIDGFDPDALTDAVLRAVRPPAPG